MSVRSEAVTEPVDETPKANPYLQILIGLLVFFAASFAALLSAAELGVAGVFVAALIEAIAIAGLYRWCAA